MIAMKRITQCLITIGDNGLGLYEPTEQYGIRCGRFGLTPAELGMRENPDFIRGLRSGRRQRRNFNDRLLITAQLVIDNCRRIRQLRGECDRLSDEISRLKNKHSSVFVRNGSFMDVKQSDYHASRQHLKSIERLYGIAVDAYVHELHRLYNIRGIDPVDTSWAA